jgi:hypothetical protein
MSLRIWEMAKIVARCFRALRGIQGKERDAVR